MRTASKWVLVAAVAVGVAGVASAQQQRQRQGGGRGMFGGGLMMLNNEAVQKELKVTDEQKEKLKTFVEEQGPKMREKMQGLFQGGGGDREKVAEKMAEINAEATKALADSKILSSDQLKRFKQIELQSQLRTQGPAVFLSADVEKTLKLTDDQKEKLKNLAGEQRKDMQELRQGGFNQESMQKMRTINKEYTTKAMDTLTADQKAKWKDLTGEPFEMPMGQRQGRPGGEGGGNRRRGGTNPPPA
ncbi:MAG TPA: hypothetical protein VGF55_20095 [Gemmataceae bacterium]|jgi:Spy/CpxP family protein refolding chaperone